MHSRANLKSLPQKFFLEALSNSNCLPVTFHMWREKKYIYNHKRERKKAIFCIWLSFSNLPLSFRSQIWFVPKEATSQFMPGRLGCKITALSLSSPGHQDLAQPGSQHQSWNLIPHTSSPSDRRHKAATSHTALGVCHPGWQIHPHPADLHPSPIANSNIRFASTSALTRPSKMPVKRLTPYVNN